MAGRFTRKDFLEALFGAYHQQNKGFILVKSSKQGDSRMSTRYFPNIDILSTENYGEEREAFFGVCPRERMRAEREHIHYLVCLWANMDIGAEGHEDRTNYFESPQIAARAIRRFPKAPSIIVESGRGAHLYWLLQEPHRIEDPEAIEATLRRINDALGCDADASLEATFRLPETTNRKIPEKPLGCDVKFINTAFRYRLEDFENLSKVSLKPTAPPRPIPAEPPMPEEPPPAPPPQAPPQQVPDQAPEPPPEYEDISTTMSSDSLVVHETVEDSTGETTVVARPPLEPIPPGPTSAPPPGAGPEPPEPAPPAHQPVSPPSTEPELRPEPPIATAQPTASFPALSTPPPAALPPRAQRLAIKGETGTVGRREKGPFSAVVAAKPEVEVSVATTGHVVEGTLVMSGEGIIGVESGENLHIIPLASVGLISTTQKVHSYGQTVSAAVSVRFSDETHLLIPEGVAVPSEASLTLRSPHGRPLTPLDLFEGTAKLKSLPLPSESEQMGADARIEVSARHAGEMLEIGIKEAQSGWSKTLGIPVPERDPVECTVHAPSSIMPRSRFLVRASLHSLRESLEGDVVTLSAETAGEIQGFETLATLMPKGAVAGFHLRMPGLMIEQEIQTVEWSGSPVAVEFVCSDSVASPKARLVRGSVTVVCNGVPAGVVEFESRIEPGLSAPGRGHPIGRVHPYEDFFVSYAAEDRSEVNRRLQMLTLAGKRFPEETMDLDETQRWERKLYKAIDACDAVLLFWSSHSRQSEWVQREWRYALEAKGPHRIVPVPVEGPGTAEQPPPDLGVSRLDEHLLSMR